MSWSNVNCAYHYGPTPTSPTALALRSWTHSVTTASDAPPTKKRQQAMTYAILLQPSSKGFSPLSTSSNTRTK
eukprot:scaffold29649_cov31-Cyclotella_meneghiniana.AAC.1